MLNINQLIGFGVGSGGHEFWRLYFITAGAGDPSSGVGSAIEIQMRASAGGVDQCVGGTATASSTEGGAAADSFDDNTATSWQSGTGLPQWIAYQFVEPVNVAELYFRPKNFFSSSSLGPESFGIEYSDNGDDWTRANTYSGLSWSLSEAKTFDVTT